MRFSLRCILACILLAGINGCQNKDTSETKIDSIAKTGRFCSSVYASSELQHWANQLFSKQANTEQEEYTTSVNRATEILQDSLNLLMDVTTPPAQDSKQLPLIILLHAGGFTEGSKDDLHSLQQEYAACGYVTATINYRMSYLALSGYYRLTRTLTHATQDLMNAIRYLKQKRVTYNIDTTRIAVVGLSAGGVVALINACEYNSFNNASNDYPSHSSQIQATITCGAALNGLVYPLLSYNGKTSHVLMWHAKELDAVTGMTWSGEAAQTSFILKKVTGSCSLIALPNKSHLTSMSPKSEAWKNMQPFLWKTLRLEEY